MGERCACSPSTLSPLPVSAATDQDTVVFFGRAFQQPQQALQTPCPSRPRWRAPPHRNRPRDMQRAAGAVDMARYYEDARRLAYLLTEWSDPFPPSATASSSPPAAAPASWKRPTGARSEAGGKTIGLNISLPFEQIPNPYITPAQLRVPLLLHAQVLVRLSRQGAGRSFPAASARWTNCSKS